MILLSINDHEGVKVNGHNIINLRHADDTVLRAGSENKLQLILDTVAEESGKRELELDIKKTECLLISKKGRIPTFIISCRGENIKYIRLYIWVLINTRCKMQHQN
ncbi:hypothetical protein PoB_004950000 [Plakobranchus ocellatus]|uniref:Reverse transcriptase domain-containing protein n=1 Tax=Plakobranchus ocellatus TaxID=259542 RepID=A0AAV4BV54_9GAST|nr:hypothetical protein PoB_004950000 [Plakobranchus ocellatus]